MRIGVEQAGAGRAREQEAGEELSCPVPLLVGAVDDHLGERCSVYPFGDEDLVALVHHVGYVHIGIVGELFRAGPLGLCLQPVVEFFGHPVA